MFGRARYNFVMDTYHFYYSIDVRYGDLDPQGHVNNAKFLTYMEQARVAYVIELGLWSGGSFLGFGFIVAEIRISYHQPVQFGAPVQVGVRTVRLGNKSLSMEYRIEDRQTRQVYARASSIGVAYDYTSNQSIRIPESWRSAITNYEKNLLEPVNPDESSHIER